MFKKMILMLGLISTLIIGHAAEPLDKVVAIINEDVITVSELNTHVESLRQQLLAKQMQLPSESILRKQVLQHLIDVNLQLQLAKKNDISVDNTDLNDALTKIAESNHLSLTQLREAITQKGLNWSTYRDNIRKEIIISRVQQKAIGNDVAISSQQVEDYLKTAQYQENAKAQQTFTLQNIVIPLPEEPTTEQVNSARQKAEQLLIKIKQGTDFRSIAIAESSGEFALEGGDLGERHLAELPELFAREVVHMNAGDVAGPLRTGNGYQLIKLVAVSGDNNHNVTKTHVRHILLKQGTSMTAQEASQQAHNLYQQIKAGKEFALMAKQYSLDGASAIKGGDLGWVGPGELVPEFEQAMDKLPLNTVSVPVKSGFGWHLIEVLERKTENDSDSYKRQQVRQFLQQRKFTEVVHNWQQHMRSQAYVHILDKALA